MTGTFNRYFTESEERQLFSAVAQFGSVLARRDHAWMRLFRATGIRVGAMSQLTCNHAREAFRTGYLELEPAIQKKQQGHRIFCTKKCQKALRDLLSVRKEQGHPETPEAPLVMSRNHKPMSVRSYQVRLTYWCRKADLDIPATPHWFRHTVAKRIMKNSEAGDPRGIAQGVLGHKSIKSTAVYTQPDKEDIEEAMRRVC